MSVVRHFVERMLRDRAMTRRLPAEFGRIPMVVSSAGGLKLLLKPMDAVDPDLFATAKALVRPGDTVWDIGANVGLFSVASAYLAGHSGAVISFEPDTELVAMLRRTARGLPATCAPVTVCPVGIAGATGLRTFAIASRARASNSLTDYGNSQMGGTREVQTIACFSADDCIKLVASPDVVKMDVEGAEVEVLAGARQLLSGHAPAMACEVAPRNAVEVTRVLREHDYKLFDATRPLSRGAEIEQATYNTIAIAARKLEKYVPD